MGLYAAFAARWAADPRAVAIEEEARIWTRGDLGTLAGRVATALRQAGAAARGAEVYVTLEPCSHHGRTPPCAQALLDAGVRRVVAAMGDPNPQVAGGGLALLQAHGIATHCGLMEAQARQLNMVRFMRPSEPVRIARRIEALERVLTKPLIAARRLARKLHTAPRLALQLAIARWPRSPHVDPDAQAAADRHAWADALAFNPDKDTS